MPLALRHPTFLTQVIEIDSSTPDKMTPHSEVIATRRVSFRIQLPAVGGRDAALLFPADVSRSCAAGKSRCVPRASEPDLEFNRGAIASARSGDDAPSERTWRRAISIKAIVVVLAAFVLVGALVILKLRRNRDRPAFVEKPLPVPPLRQPCGAATRPISRLTKGFKCRCGNQPFRTEALSHRETLLCDGERLGTFKLKCETCGRVSDVYFVQTRACPPRRFLIRYCSHTPPHSKEEMI